jgi:hypothetical protein
MFASGHCAARVYNKLLFWRLCWTTHEGASALCAYNVINRIAEPWERICVKTKYIDLHACCNTAISSLPAIPIPLRDVTFTTSCLFSFSNMSAKSLLWAALFLGLWSSTSAYLVDPPSTASADTVSDCSGWHVPTIGDSCDSIAEGWLITTKDFIAYVSD